jgi:magnesium-transporting ATPase (P-type)
MSNPNTMTVDGSSSATGSSAAARTILWGTLVAGTMDISAAIISWALRDVSAERVLQGVATGVLGSEARNGGTWTAALGLLLHYVIMIGIVAVFYFASRRLSFLTRRWLLAGIAYGVAVYIVMTFIVVPLSASPGGFAVPPLPRLIQGVLIHIACVGVPIAFITRRMARI